MTFTKTIAKGLPNPGFRSVKVENWDFLKKDLQDFKISFQHGFLWIPSKTGEQNYNVPYFDSHNCKKKIVYGKLFFDSQCDLKCIC